MRLFLVLNVLLCACLSAQSTIDTDRPDQTESSAVLPQHSFQIESGVQVNYTETDRGTESAWLYPTNLLRYGISEHFELRLVQELASSEVAGEQINGVNDLQFGVKVQLFQKENSATEVAFLSHAVAPTGTEGLSIEEWGTINRFLISHQINPHLSVGYNLGYNYLGQGDGDFVYTLALALDVNDKLGLYVEPFGEWQDFADFRHSFDTGIAYLVHDNLQLDFSFGFGLNHTMNYVAVGLSWRALGLNRQAKQKLR